MAFYYMFYLLKRCLSNRGKGGIVKIKKPPVILGLPKD